VESIDQKEERNVNMGEQHFEQVMNWKPPETSRYADRIKMSRAIEHGISIIRLYRLDIFPLSFNQESYNRFASFFLHKREIPTIEFIANDETVYDDFEDEIMNDDSFASNLTGEDPDPTVLILRSHFV
jgi:hypothetical protein